MRRKAIGILVAMGLISFAIQADDFWVKKDWKEWTEYDCRQMLQDSPWARSTGVGLPVSAHAYLPNDGNSVSKEMRTPSGGGDAIRYVVADWSTAPVRQAYIRLAQIQNNYEKMDPALKKEFDAKAENFLNEKFGNVILIHVTYGGGGSGSGGESPAEYWRTVSEDQVLKSAFLINQREERIPAAQFISPKGAEPVFELVFPRLQRGEPAVQQNDKSFSIEFQGPGLRLEYPMADTGTAPEDQPPPKVRLGGQARVLAVFDAQKMMWLGSPNM